MRLILSILFSVSVSSLVAGHLIGGEISYECIGNDQYVVSLKMYRDCNASGVGVATQFDNVVNISIYSGSTNTLIEVLQISKPQDSTIFPLVLNVNCIVDPPDLCIIGMEYLDTLTLAVPPGGIHLVHQRCCRTSSALNLINPGDIGSTYHAYIPNTAICNNSPKFNQPPPIAICTQVSTDLDFSATDPDGDSLVYRLCDPFVGGNPNAPVPQTPGAPPFTKASWSAGFSTQYQIPSFPAFEIDSITGILSGKPTFLGDYVIAVCVEEYRYGMLIGENRRDFQIQAIACNIDAAAAVDSTLEECAGLTIQFFNLSTIGNRFIWDFGDTTTLGDTSSLDNPTYTFPDTGIYNVILIAGGDVCSDTSLVQYHVKPRLEAKYTAPESQCLEGNVFELEAEGWFYRETTEITWGIDLPTTGDSARVGLTTGRFTGLEAGTFPVHVRYSDFGCNKTYTDSIVIIPNPEIDLIVDNSIDCIPFNSVIKPSPSMAYLPRYTWGFEGDTVAGDSLPIFIDSAGTYGVWLQMYTDSACIDTVEIEYSRAVIGLDTPRAEFSVLPEIAGMYEPNFFVVDSSINARSISFSLDWEEDLYSERSFPLYLPDTGNHLLRLVATHKSGCTDTAYRTIRTEPEYQFWAPNAFTPDGNSLNPEWKPLVFIWREYSLRIYDRWGEVIFTSTNPNNGWNGKRDNIGKDCPMGTYGYTIQLEDKKRRDWHYKGVINLIR